MANDGSTHENERHQRSVEQILRRARHDVGLRDVLVLFGARIWTVALAVGAAVFVQLGKWLETAKDQTEKENRSQSTGNS